jgi:chromosome segregation ATPase
LVTLQARISALEAESSRQAAGLQAAREQGTSDAATLAAVRSELDQARLQNKDLQAQLQQADEAAQLAAVHAADLEAHVRQLEERVSGAQAELNSARDELQQVARDKVRLPDFALIALIRMQGPACMHI